MERPVPTQASPFAESLFAALDPLRAQSILDRATVYRPRIGWRHRVFTTAALVERYEDGFDAYPGGLPIELIGSAAALMGYHDAEADHFAVSDARADRDAEAA